MKAYDIWHCSHSCFSPFLHLKSFSEQITVFRNIASHYNMSFLEETIDWLLVMSPHISQNTHQMWSSLQPFLSCMWKLLFNMENGLLPWSCLLYGKLPGHWSGRLCEKSLDCRYFWSRNYVLMKCMCVNFKFWLLIKYFLTVSLNILFYVTQCCCKDCTSPMKEKAQTSWEPSSLGTFINEQSHFDWASSSFGC